MQTRSDSKGMVQGEDLIARRRNAIEEADGRGNGGNFGKPDRLCIKHQIIMTTI